LNHALSYIGGIVESDFDMVFDATSLGGLYDRFLFGYKAGWKMDYTPYPFPVVCKDEGWDCVPVYQDPSVFEVTKGWNKQHPQWGRVVEIMVRVATTYASLDGRTTITGSDILKLEPLAVNQAAIRGKFNPNVGLTPDAKFQNSVINWLKSHTAGEWVPLSKVKQGCHAYEMSLGPNVALRAISAMGQNGTMVDVWVKRIDTNGDYLTPVPEEWKNRTKIPNSLIRLKPASEG
jgi:hypothetical protein